MGVLLGMLDEVAANLGTKWENYEVLFGKSSVASVANETWTTFLNITGAGYLHSAIGDANGNVSMAVVRVTVDGVVVHNGGPLLVPANLIIAANDAFGVLNPGGGFSYLNNYAHHPDRTYPYTGAVAGASVHLPQPIFFNSSLVVEVKNGTGMTNSVRCIYMGGVK